MLIPRSVLAARKCGDTTSSRYALGGIFFTRHNDQPYAVATDGRKLVALTWQEPTVGSATGIDLTPQPGCEFTVPTAALDKVAACKIGAKSKKDLDRYVGVQEPADDKAVTTVMLVSNGEESARFEPRLQEGRFPRWRDVAPAPSTRDITFCCDARLLMQVLEAITAHTGSNGDSPASVVFSLNPEKTFIRPIVITAADANGNKAIGVMMPLGTDDKGSRPANRWQAEPAADEPPPAPIAPAPAVEPIAEVPAPAPEVAAEIPPPAPPAPVDNRPIGRRPRSPRRPCSPELVTVAGRAYDNDEASNY